MTWKYFRDSEAKYSEWVLGPNSVTKWDDQPLCAIVILGFQADLEIESPKLARQAVQGYLGTQNQSKSILVAFRHA